MKRSEINAWTAALRSGDYKQGSRRLAKYENADKRDFTFCCLGVLCEIDSTVTGEIEIGATHHEDTVVYFHYGSRATHFLPPNFSTEKHFIGPNGRFEITHGEEARILRDIIYEHHTTRAICDIADSIVNRVAAEVKYTTELSTLNDRGLSFAGIADVIEAFDQKIFSHIEEDV